MLVLPRDASTIRPLPVSLKEKEKKKKKERKKITGQLTLRRALRPCLIER